MAVGLIAVHPSARGKREVVAMGAELGNWEQHIWIFAI